MIDHDSHVRIFGSRKHPAFFRGAPMTLETSIGSIRSSLRSTLNSAGQLLPGALYTICLDKDGVGATHIFQAYGSWVKKLGESGGIYHDIYIITIILYIYIHNIYIYNICLYIHTPSGYLTVRHGKIHHAINR
jgi:hypothetical protein